MVAAPTGVVISITQRNKRKFVTNVVGLGSYGINLKKASKAFAGRLVGNSCRPPLSTPRQNASRRTLAGAGHPAVDMMPASLFVLC